MGHGNIREVSIDNSSEGMGTMIEIKVQTMDSQTRYLHINNQITVRDLKEHIAALNGMSIEQQRLIYCGKVLWDDQLLSAYNITSGDTLHLVHNQLSLPCRPGIANNSEASMHDVHGSASSPFLPSLESTPEVLEWLAELLSSSRNLINGTAEILIELEGDIRDNLIVDDQMILHRTQTNLWETGGLCQSLGEYILGLGQALMQLSTDQTEGSPLQQEEYDHGAGVQSLQVHTQARRAGGNASPQALSDTISLPPCHHPHDGRSSSAVVEVENRLVVIENEPSVQNEEGRARVLQQNAEGAVQEGVRDHGRHDNLSTNAMDEYD